MSDHRNRKVTPAEFLQQVRQFPRDTLLHAIASVAGELARDRSNLSRIEKEWSAVQESYLFHIAGICVTTCNNYRDTPVSRDTLLDLVETFAGVCEADLDGPYDDETRWCIMAQSAFLQAPYRQSLREPVARTLCLFGDDPRFGPPVLDERRWEEILGATLPRFLTNGFAMYAIATKLPGGITRMALHSSLQALGGVGAHVLESWHSRPVRVLYRRGRQRTQVPVELWRYNPFFEWPITMLSNDTYLTPSPLAVLQRVSPQGLCFVGLKALGPSIKRKAFREFADALNHRFERYVGEQLRFIRYARLHSKIVYDDGQESVDYIIETPEVLVLVEVTSVAPHIQAHAGIFPEGDDIRKKIKRACRNIATSAATTEQGHPALPELKGRKIRGLVMTREHYFNLQMPFMGRAITPESVPTTVVSSQQLEDAIPVLSDDADCGTSLLGALASDPRVLKTSLDPLPLGRNQLLGEIGDRWFDEHGLREP